MKKILVVILALVAVFCTFAGCNDAAKDNNTGNNTNVTDNSGDNGKTGNTGNGENEGGDNGNGNGGSGKVVQPITDGGDYDGGGNYS